MAPPGEAPRVGIADELETGALLLARIGDLPRAFGTVADEEDALDAHTAAATLPVEAGAAGGGIEARATADDPPPAGGADEMPRARRTAAAKIRLLRRSVSEAEKKRVSAGLRTRRESMSGST